MLMRGFRGKRLSMGVGAGRQPLASSALRRFFYSSILGRIILGEPFALTARIAIALRGRHR
jgi:hypothetical protein